MKKIVKLTGKDVKNMVERIIAESNQQNEPINKEIKRREPQKPVVTDKLIPEGRQPKRKRVVRLTESEMIEFLDKLATRVENSKKRRGLK